LDHAPPPFFRQGPSARARVIFFALAAIVLILTDSRFHLLNAVRYGVGTALYPLQWALLQPSLAFKRLTGHFQDTEQLLSDNQKMQRNEIALSLAQTRAAEIAAENTRLRGLLDLKSLVTTNSILAEVQFENRDPYTRRYIVNKGGQHGVLAGQPVLDSQGVAGLVTRVYPASSEVALITDKEITLPVQVIRTGQRSIAYGAPALNQLELRFLPGNADIKEGDVFVTSGLDTLYPAGLAVGSVTKLERSGGSAFTKAWLAPAAQLQNASVLMILLTAPSSLPDIPAAPIETKKRARAKS
jgi:rod shape-determining protein MreC